MQSFTDLHCHMLYETDDGARDETEMYEMLDMSYRDGIRSICFTPHFNPTFWGDHHEAEQRAFEKAVAYVVKYPGLTLFRGNELFFESDMITHLHTGTCRTLNGSRYLLVDFVPEVSFFELRSALRTLSSEGLSPVLAHAERYLCLYKNPKLAYILTEECRAIIQINASSLFGEWGKTSKKIADMLLKHHLAQVVASDCHRKDVRLPGLSAAFRYVGEKYGEKQAKELFDIVPYRILQNKVL